MINYDKLQKLKAEIDKLTASYVLPFSSEFKSWHGRCIRYFENNFGKDSAEYKQFSNIKFESALIDDKQDHLWCIEGLKIAKDMFDDILDENEQAPTAIQNKVSENKIFVVHGRNDALKETVARLLEQQDIEPIILHELSSGNKTLIEKLEHYSKDVRAAIILITPDDDGKLKTEDTYKSRARQNVIFEAGYFIGYLGRENVSLIVSDDKSIELPSDLNGVVYANGMWQYILMNELKAMGFDIDLNKVRI